jgi:hypothetical protein
MKMKQVSFSAKASHQSQILPFTIACICLVVAAAAAALLRDCLRLGLCRMDLAQHLPLDTPVMLGCKQDLSASTLCFSGCKSDCIQHRQETQDSSDSLGNNSLAGSAVCIEEMRNARGKLGCSSDSKDCIWSSWASKMASSESNAGSSSLDSTESRAVWSACSLDSMDCSLVLSMRTEENEKSSWGSMANSLDSLANIQATLGCSSEMSASKD